MSPLVITTSLTKREAVAMAGALVEVSPAGWPDRERLDVFHNGFGQRIRVNMFDNVKKKKHWRILLCDIKKREFPDRIAFFGYEKSICSGLLVGGLNPSEKY